MNVIQKTSIVKVDGVDKEHYQAQASLCNIKFKSPAAIFVVPSLAPQDKLTTYRAEWNPVLDEWHVTHHPKKFVDAWGMNPQVFGEPRQPLKIVPATPKVVQVEEKSKLQEPDTAEASCNKDEHRTPTAFEYQDLKCTENVKDNDDRSQLVAVKRPLGESKAPTPGVADNDQAGQAMTVDTSLAQGSFKPSGSSSPKVEACLTKLTSSSPLLPSPPTTASSVPLREKTPTTPSAASSPKQQVSPSTSLPSTPEKASPPQVTVPASPVNSCEPKSQSASAAPESTSIFPKLSNKGKGEKKGKGKKTKAGKNARADKDDKNLQKPKTWVKKVVSLPGTDKSIADSEKTVENDMNHEDAEKTMNNGTKAEVLVSSATAPAPAAVVPVAEKIPSHATPAASGMLVRNPNSSAGGLGGQEDSAIEKSILLSPANTKTSPSIPMLHQQTDVCTSSHSPPRDKGSVPTELPSNTEKVSSVTNPSTSPAVSEKPPSSNQRPNPAGNAGLIPCAKGKGKKKGRAGKKMQAKKAATAVKDESASKTDLAKDPEDVKMISTVPEAIETIADTISSVSHANDSTSVVVTEKVEPSQSEEPFTVKVSGKDYEIEDAAKAPAQDAIISPVLYNSDRLLLAAGSSTSSEKVQPAASKDEHNKESDFKYRDEMPDIIVTNTDDRVTDVPYNIDPRLEVDAGEGASDQSHRTLPQETPLTLGMLKNWINGGNDEVQAEPLLVENSASRANLGPSEKTSQMDNLPRADRDDDVQAKPLAVEDSAPRANLGPSEVATQVDDLPRIDNSTRVEETVIDTDIKQSDDIAEVVTGDDSPATVTKKICDSPSVTDTDCDVAIAHDVHNPLRLLRPGETSVVLEEMDTSPGGCKRPEELVPKSESVGKASTSDNPPVDVVAGQPGSAIEANLGLDANTARDDEETLKQDDENNAQASCNGDPAVAAVEELPDSPSKATVDLDKTVQPFYNPSCLLLPGETSWIIEKMKSSAMGDTNEEELEQKNPDQPSVGQHDDAQPAMDATNLGIQESNCGPEFPAEQLDDDHYNTGIEVDTKPRELSLETGMVTGSPTPVDDLPKLMTPQDIEHDIPEHSDDKENNVATPQLPTEQAEPALPIEASKDPAPEAAPGSQETSSRGLRTQKLAEVAAMVSEATATISQSLHANVNASDTASADEPANHRASTEQAKEAKSSILDPEKLVEVATTVPKTREERFLLLELICVLIVRFVGSLFM